MMATANEYAQWIVNNQAKRGTPEFGIVASAYEAAKAEENLVAEQSASAAVPVDRTPSFVDKAIGAGETALAIGTGATGGTLGMIGGTLKGIAEQLLSGNFGTPEAAAMVRKSAEEGAAALTRAPRTQAGQEMTAGVAGALSGLPAFVPAIGVAPGVVGRTAAAVAPAVESMAAKAGGAVQDAGAAARQAVSRAVGPAIVPGVDDVPTGTIATAGRRSAGAEALPLEVQRATEAEMAGLKLTEGETKRSPEMLAWEKEKARTPEYQAEFLERQRENNLAAIKNLENALDDTGAETGTNTDTGIRVVDTIMEGYAKEKAKTREKYKEFRESQEAASPVDPAPLAEFLNTQARGVAGVTGVSDTARQNAVRLGILAEGEDGSLAVRPGVTLGRLEDFRQSISAIGPSSANDKRLISIIKKLTDDIGDPVGGALTKAMRAQRRNQAAKFENRAIIARLLLEKRGMSDPQVPIEEVFQKTILSARPSEIAHVRRVLKTIDVPEADQTWRELQGATVRHIIKESESGLGSDNLPIISSVKLNKAVEALDNNGKLDMVLGKQAAEQIRNLNQVLKYVQSVPPGTSINNSGTARTVMALLAETGIMGSTVGIPVPVIQGMKMLKNEVNDRRIKARITAALNYKPARGE